MIQFSQSNSHLKLLYAAIGPLDLWSNAFNHKRKIAKVCWATIHETSTYSSLTVKYIIQALQYILYFQFNSTHLYCWPFNASHKNKCNPIEHLSIITRINFIILLASFYKRSFHLAIGLNSMFIVILKSIIRLDQTTLHCNLNGDFAGFVFGVTLYFSLIIESLRTEFNLLTRKCLKLLL